MSIAILGFVFLQIFLPLAQAQTCYYPDGSVAENDVACSPTQPDGLSGCCGHGYECLSAGLCHAAGTSLDTIDRMSCTDQYWQSEYCTKVCLNPDDNTLNGPNQLNRCNDLTHYYCVNQTQGAVNDPACGSDEEVHDYAAQSAFKTIPFLYTFTTSSSSGSITSPATVSAGTTASATTSSTMSTSSTPATRGGSSGSTNVGAAAGAGVGAGLAVILLACLGLFMYRRKKRKQAYKSVPSHSRQTPYETYVAPAELSGQGPMAEMPASEIKHNDTTSAVIA